jgi:hypothetical protein
VVYSTYIGGAADDSASGIAIDGAGNAYVVGWTTSANFPVVTPYQSAYRGETDVFLLKIGDLAGPSCTYSISPTNQSFGATGGASSIAVTSSAAGCGWNTTNALSWVTITSGSGTGSGHTTYSVAANVGATPRSGTFTVAGHAFTVNQAGDSAPGSGPTPANDAYATNSNTSLTVPAPGVLANDNSNGGGGMTATLVSGVTSGTLAFNADGSFAYTPGVSFVGTDSFIYRATNGAGNGSATVTITVNPPSANPPTGPQPPTALRVSSMAGNVVTFRWTPPTVGSAPTEYVLEGGISPGHVFASLPTGSASPIFTVAAPTGVFYVRVRTLDGAARSDASNEIQLFVNVPQPPTAPTSTLGLANGSRLDLAWVNTFGGGAPTGLVLEVSGATTVMLPLALTDHFSFAGVPPGTYTFRLRATNAAGSSPPSNEVTLTFPGICALPGTPAAFLAFRTGNTLSVIWDSPTSGAAPTGYVLNVSGSLNLSLPLQTRGLSGTVFPGTYTFTVAATNPCGTSVPTPAQTVVVP